MENEIIDFINSFKLQPTDNNALGYNFNIYTSDHEIISKTEKSFKFKDLQSAIDVISNIKGLKSKNDIQEHLTNDLKSKLVDSEQGFYLVIDVKYGQPFP